jgi:(E)-4-hydroxy-3-methylbut-2-enyl-diphosphate synthase
MLLWSGIGHTIRISLSADPVDEVKAGFEILKSLNLRRRGVAVISCPSCACQQFEVIKTVERLGERLAHITTPMTASVIGCVVNGPGEARETDIGFTGGGNGTHQVYINRLTDHRLKNADIVDHLVELVEKKLPRSKRQGGRKRNPASQQRSRVRYAPQIHWRLVGIMTPRGAPRAGPRAGTIWFLLPCGASPLPG